MYQVIVDVSGLEAFEGYTEETVKVLGFPAVVLGQLGGDEHALPDAVALHDAAERLFAARVEVSGIEVVHPAFERAQYQLFGGLFIDDSRRLAWEPHAAET